MEVKVKTKQEVHIYVMLVVQFMHDSLLKRHSFCWALHAKWCPSARIDEKNPKLNTTSGGSYMEVMVNTKLEMHIQVILALQCMHDNWLKRHSFCWALHAKWYPSVRIDEKNPSQTRPREEVIWRSRSTQNRRCTSRSCWHRNACMIIC